MMVWMAKTQRLVVAGGDDTWTVLGVNYLPVPEIESFLEHLRQTGRSPNTVRSYARALSLWWDFLDLTGRQWSGVSIEDFGRFLGWLRTGLHPDVEPIAALPVALSDSTVSIRLQAVRSFYRYHQLRGRDVVPWLYETAGSRGGRYQPFLAHIRSRPPARPVVSVPRRRRSPPTLTPRQIEAIKDSCARFDPVERRWAGSVRDRLLFSLLEETGLRLGEALSVQHRDWHSGRGENPFIEVVPRPHPHGLRVKGGGYRKLYISDELDRLYAELVWQLCNAGMDVDVADIDEAYVLVNQRGANRFGPMRPETVYKLIARISRRLGNRLPAGWSPHWFRHTHASALLLSGTPVHVVSRRLGHSDVQTTLNTYAWVIDDEELRAVADRKIVTEGWRTDRADG